MQPFETVDHTADLALVARGNTLAELFANVAHGLFHQVADLSHQRDWDDERQWQLSAEEPEDLLLAWLRDLLYEHEVEERVFGEFEVAVEGRYELRASGRSGPLAAGEPLTDIKAVTYHDLQIVRVQSHLEVKVVFDL